MMQIIHGIQFTGFVIFTVTALWFGYGVAAGWWDGDIEMARYVARLVGGLAVCAVIMGILFFRWVMS